MAPKVYMGTSALVCILFLYLTLTGREIFDFSDNTVKDLAGPSTGHYHK
jgi:hypothetical protein